MRQGEAGTCRVRDETRAARDRLRMNGVRAVIFGNGRVRLDIPYARRFACSPKSSLTPFFENGRVRLDLRLLRSRDSAAAKVDSDPNFSGCLESFELH